MNMRILTLCGSLRARSSNRALLRAYGRLAPSSMVVQHDEQLGELPHFNPDLDGEKLPHEVEALRRSVADADAVVISTPEYAHGLPGTFKNALDWLVSDPAFVGKPVVILHASRGSMWALDSLREVLRTMSARIIETASVWLPLGSNQLDTDAILTRDDLRQLLLHSIEALEIEAKMKALPKEQTLRVRPILMKHKESASRGVRTNADQPGPVGATVWKRRGVIRKTIPGA